MDGPAVAIDPAVLVSDANGNPAGAGMMTASGMKMPEVSPLLLGGLLVYFLLGFLLYSALFAAVGACVNTSQEAQGLAFPVMMPLIAGVMMFPMIM